jgi:redox-sensitive bicupin YhaK (pirin superfamily)
MSNLEKDPLETLVAPATGETLEVLEPREVPLGGPRALTVRRTLPQRSRSLIGPWCFADHYGPDIVSGAGAMDVPPHPHTGLQTVSWLFAGEVEHRDSTGAVAFIRPGQVNLMTAGRGIQHSEVSTAATATLHGVQLWLALPDAARHVAPFFEHDEPEPVRVGDAVLRVFAGSLAGSIAKVTAYSPLVAAQVDLPAGGGVELPVDPAFEHGLLVDSGRPTLLGTEIPEGHLGVTPTGRESLRIDAGDRAVRAVLIGGEPFGEAIVMWWNFVGRSHDEIVAFREQWQVDVIGGADAAGRFGTVVGYPGAALPAPELPNVRLNPRD